VLATDCTTRSQLSDIKRAAGRHFEHQIKVREVEHRCTWDAANHMTKEDLGRTCRRLAEERVKFRLERSKEFNPQKV
jgi:hypothetical protein